MPTNPPTVGQKKLISDNATLARCIRVDENQDPVLYLMRYYDADNRHDDLWCTIDELSEGT